MARIWVYSRRLAVPGFAALAIARWVCLAASRCGGFAALAIAARLTACQS
ncbi:hypothetical protein HX92_0796 [Mycobacterium tuberculosis]|uniref:Uncharacterized protein n=1 Tax=Mycobacterium tuberculosis str. Haarlem/NITR202 TaxID=1304279 RepID=R4LY37_MYCTX|nr:hypothetical protein I917_19375 [Mycobacterium tuberculosis str. Haarlem/NITR202]AGM01354.1 hypothetical protein CFBS_2921 [Mycobacterium tuberculosis CCDC5079]AHJ43562.1 hypothetical protein HKBS1_2916 [Mycobacterium tuberculosis HKBS1]AHJ47709.1 hypothetical protein HKBT2_2912 [Mycobacterium tuberculosis BT2]AHJ51855.1 hypothetical protein HKBT1_2909 [Mycobacterium tuberculosis BT1]AHJ56004.1 hypothetical protein CFBR_2919 [Mycobacterium tuberculosis CCDC5180]AHM08513.1 hypothetical prot